MRGGRAAAASRCGELRRGGTGQVQCRGGGGRGAAEAGPRLQQRAGEEICMAAPGLQDTSGPRGSRSSRSCPRCSAARRCSARCCASASSRAREDDRGGPRAASALLAAGERRLLMDSAAAPDRGGARRAVDRLAGVLLARGLAHRRIGLWSWNSLAAAEALMAVEWVGGTRVPVDPGAAPEEARAVFAAAGVEAVLATRARWGPSRCADHRGHHRAARSARRPGLTVEADRTLLLYPRSVVEGQLLAVPISYANWAATLELNVRLYRSGRVRAAHSGRRLLPDRPAAHAWHVPDGDVPSC